jgi:hypothetical protein
MQQKLGFMWPYRVYPRLVVQAADEDECQGSDEPTNVFADNKSVLCNARAMASTLKKKQYALVYHFV